MKVALGVLAALAVTVLVVVLAVGFWHLGWGVHRANVNKDYQVNRESQNYQAAQIAKDRDLVMAYDTSTDDGQRAQIKAQFCAVYTDLTSKPTDLVSAATHIGC